MFFTFKYFYVYCYKIPFGILAWQPKPLTSLGGDPILSRPGSASSVMMRRSGAAQGPEKIKVFQQAWSDPLNPYMHRKMETLMHTCMHTYLHTSRT